MVFTGLASFPRAWERLPTARFGLNCYALTVTSDDRLPGFIPFGAGPMHGSGTPPSLPWTWGWAWLDGWVLRPIWIPPFPETWHHHT
jgi:hypothetical protein